MPREFLDPGAPRGRLGKGQKSDRLKAVGMVVKNCNRRKSFSL